MDKSAHVLEGERLFQPLEVLRPNEAEGIVDQVSRPEFGIVGQR